MSPAKAWAELKKELKWILVVLATSVGVKYLLLDPLGPEGLTEMGTWTIIAVFFGLGFGVYMIKEGIRRFAFSVPNLLSMIFGVAFFISLEIWYYLIFMPVGWTVYPPLSALPNFSPIYDPYSRLGAVFTVMQLGILVSLLFVAYRWGRQSVRK